MATKFCRWHSNGAISFNASRESASTFVFARCKSSLIDVRAVAVKWSLELRDNLCCRGRSGRVDCHMGFMSRTSQPSIPHCL